MTMTKTIPAERLQGLDLHQGDTLHIVSLVDSAFLVEISRADDQSTPPRGKAGEWLLSARGSVKLSANETVDDARMSYYAGKYGLNA
ncbi:MAG: hypothetical protein ACKVY0_05625 [Prosthecobacter sp.]|uniref:hypothetical protein n=1 Tax=Prosthecobacter sp. TaxID=1965333 RepID=UPI0038FD4111